MGIRKGGMRVNRCMYFVYIYKNRRMKPVEIVLRRGEDRRGIMMKGVNTTKIYCKHICKYRNAFLV
jgi:hypothetical protein